MRHSRARFSLLSLGVLLLSLSRASADLAALLPEIGSLEHWSVFTLGASAQKNEIAGTAYVDGEVGIAGMAHIALDGNSTIDGDLFYRSNGAVRTSPGAVITGAQINNQDAQLDSDMEAALAASRNAARLDRTVTGPNDVQLRGAQALTVSGAPGESVVLKLDSFTLRGNSTFTLEGTATTTFIINVSRQFALRGNAQVVLSGGLQWNNVLFNVTGTRGAVSLRGSANFSGVILASRRTVQLAGNANVTGTVIANRVSFNNSGFNGNATVGHPPLVSP